MTAKLEASDRTQAVVRALKLGLIDFPESPGCLVPLQSRSTPREIPETVLLGRCAETPSRCIIESK